MPVPIPITHGRSTTGGASELLVKPGKSEAEINHRLHNRIDEIPPAKIEDLVVMATDFAAGNVTLAWTATGDNYDEGKASFNQIRWQKNIDHGQAAAETPQWFRIAKNRDVSTGPFALLFVLSLTPLIHSLPSSWENE